MTQDRADPGGDPAAARCSQAQASGTLSGVLSDLAAIADQMPVPAGRAEAVARMLDHLSAELASAATMLRTAAG
jgi:hypothetical protein